MKKTVEWIASFGFLIVGLIAAIAGALLTARLTASLEERLMAQTLLWVMATSAVGVGIVYVWRETGLRKLIVRSPLWWLARAIMGIVGLVMLLWGVVMVAPAFLLYIAAGRIVRVLRFWSATTAIAATGGAGWFIAALGIGVALSGVVGAVIVVVGGLILIVSGWADSSTRHMLSQQGFGAGRL